MSKWFFVLMILLSGGFANAGKWHSELGSPIYVLSKAVNPKANREFRIYELRPPERDSVHFYSGSKILVSSSAFVPVAFGFVGHQILDDLIETGELRVLDADGGLWSADLSKLDTPSSVKWVKLPGRHKSLDAESLDFAGDAGEWVLDASTSQVSYRGIVADLRSHVESRQDGAKLEALGSDGAVLYFRLGANAYKAYLTPDSSKISIVILAQDFFGSEIRKFGVNNGLGITVSVVQPRLAERNGVRRKDLGEKLNPICGVVLSPPRTRVAPGIGSSYSVEKFHRRKP